MTKAELIADIAGQAGLSKAETGRIVDAFFKSISNALNDSGRITLTGFGTFTVAERAARTGRNPQTGEPMEIKASRTVKFKPGKGLKDAI